MIMNEAKAQNILPYKIKTVYLQITLLVINKKL